jgi:hypothetical protein
MPDLMNIQTKRKKGRKKVNIPGNFFGLWANEIVSDWYKSFAQ